MTLVILWSPLDGSPNCITSLGKETLRELRTEGQTEQEALTAYAQTLPASSFVIVDDQTIPAEPTPPARVVVTAAQAKIALHRRGLLLDVENAIAAYPRDVQLWFSDARDWDRNNAYVQGIGLELGLSDEQVDELFVFAATIEH